MWKHNGESTQQIIMKTGVKLPNLGKMKKIHGKFENTAQKLVKILKFL